MRDTPCVWRFRPLPPAHLDEDWLLLLVIIPTPWCAIFISDRALIACSMLMSELALAASETEGATEEHASHGVTISAEGMTPAKYLTSSIISPPCSSRFGPPLHRQSDPEGASYRGAGRRSLRKAEPIVGKHMIARTFPLLATIFHFTPGVELFRSISRCRDHGVRSGFRTVPHRPDTWQQTEIIRRQDVNKNCGQQRERPRNHMFADDRLQHFVKTFDQRLEKVLTPLRDQLHLGGGAAGPNRDEHGAENGDEYGTRQIFRRRCDPSALMVTPCDACSSVAPSVSLAARARLPLINIEQAIKPANRNRE